MDNNVKLNDVITYLKKYNFTNFCYLSQNKLIKIEDMVNFIFDTIKQAQKHGYPAKIKAIHNGIINDHYNYSNIVCINKNSDLLSFTLKIIFGIVIGDFLPINRRENIPKFLCCQ